MKVTILSKQGCIQCDNAADFLTEKGIVFEKRMVDKEKLFDICGKRVPGYPQILIDGKHIGNNFDMEDYIEDNFEPLLAPSSARFTAFPIKHQELWDLYKQAQGSFWTAEEIDFSQDLKDWEKRTKK